MYLNWCEWPPRKGSSLTVLTQLNVYVPVKGNFSRNIKWLAEETLTQCWKDVASHFIKLWHCNVATTWALRSRSVTAMSLFKVATTLSTDVGKTFISSELTMLIQPIVRRCEDVVTISLCLLGWLDLICLAFKLTLRMYIIAFF